MRLNYSPLLNLIFIQNKGVMKQHQLGPNGAIMTSLNLFATKFDQVIALLEKRSSIQAPAKEATQEENSSTSEEQKPQNKMPSPLDYIVVRPALFSVSLHFSLRQSAILFIS